MVYTIKHNQIAAKVSSLGAELISLNKSGTEYIWQGDEKYWKGQNPILFPVLCSLKDGKATIGEKEISLPKHGFARKSEFSLTSLSDNSITLTLKESEETLKLYPFPFIFSVTHTVTDSGFETSFTIENPGTESIMFHIGGHTGFNIPINGKGEFNAHKLVFSEIEYATNYKAPTGGLIVNPKGSHDVLNGSNTLSLEYSMFDNDAIMIADLKSDTVSLLDKDGHGVRMRISDFGALGIWTPAHKESPFVCLEPWNGLPAFENESGRFEDKPFAISLNPGNAYKASYSVEII